MKNIYLGFAISLVLFSGCENGDGILGKEDFGDYTEQNVYFPIQYPIRTLILGEDRIDNSIDNEHAFHIGASIGGLRENTMDVQLEYTVAPTLLSNLKGLDVKSGLSYDMKMMPSSYYTIENEGKATIGKGSFNGLIRVNLTDAFFNDPDAIHLTYAIPLQLNSTSYGNLMNGKSLEGITSPNPLNSSDWITGAQPKNYTIFAVKFINPWHGDFFQRGVQKLNGVTDQTFHTQDLEDGQISKIVTAGYRTSLYQRMGKFSGSTYASLLTFSESSNGQGTITVSAPAGSTYTIAGTGKYYESSTDFAKQYGSWLLDPVTGKDTPHLTLTLDYQVQGLGGVSNLYQFADTLVFRDKAITYEEFTPSLVP